MMASIRINDLCNFECKYCFNHLDHQTGCQMSLQTADKVLDYCLKHDIDSINIPQKEPTMSPGILKHIIQSYEHQGIHTQGITTNGYNIDNDLIEILDIHNVHVLVSYDGLWHSEYRQHMNGSDTEEQVRDNIFRLKDAGVRHSIACNIFHGVTDHILMNYNYLRMITPAMAFNFDVSSPYAVQNCDLRAIADAFSDIAKTDLNIFPLNRIAQRLKQNAHYSNHMCGAGRGSYTINWDGAIYPCYHVPAWIEMGICLGDIQHGVNPQEQEKFRHYDTSQPNKCKNCNSALCGICYTASHDVSGNMLEPIPINCQIFNTLTNIVKEVI